MESFSPLNLSFQPAKESDVSPLVWISRATFHETFSELNTPEDMQQYTETALSSEQLLSEIQNPNSRFFIVRHNETLLGYLKLNMGLAPEGNHSDTAVELERIYILKSYLGMGIGQSLLDFAFQQAQQAAFKQIWLGVWEKNHRAIRFYTKNGFSTFGSKVFMLGEDAQRDIVMIRDLDR